MRLPPRTTFLLFCFVAYPCLSIFTVQGEEQAAKKTEINEADRQLASSFLGLVKAEQAYVDAYNDRTPGLFTKPFLSRLKAHVALAEELHNQIEKGGPLSLVQFDITKAEGDLKVAESHLETAKKTYAIRPTDIRDIEIKRLEAEIAHKKAWLAKLRDPAFQNASSDEQFFWRRMQLQSEIVEIQMLLEIRRPR